MKTILLVSCLLALALGEMRSYRGYQVVRVSVEDRAQADLVHAFEEDLALSFWNEVRVGGQVDIMIPPTRTEFIGALRTLGLDAKVTIPDVQKLIDDERESGAMKSVGDKHDWVSYHPLENIYRYWDELAATNPDVSIVTIGQSYEGTDMRVLQICRGVCGNNPGMWIQAGIHAREWISPAVATYLVEQLTNQLTDEHDNLVAELDWYILPSVNPDGYKYTQTNDRLWRRTRSDTGSALCLGVDANRNYDFHWGEGGSSTSPCSDTYMGPESFSEVENRNIRDFILSKPEGYFEYFQDLHSYSQLALLPWGWTNSLPNDYTALKAVIDEANDALYAVHQKSYEVGATYSTIYQASGIAVDWGRGAANITYAVSIELRDTGLYGFQLPPTEIIPCGEEIWAFHVHLGNHIIREKQNQK